MKINRKTVALLIFVLMILTVVVAVPNLDSGDDELRQLKAEAESLYEKDLCARSLAEYQKVLSIEDTLVTRLKIADVYKKGLSNGEFNSIYDYTDFLVNMTDLYRSEHAAYEKSLSELMRLEDYENASAVLKKAESFGIENEGISSVRQELRTKYRYNYSYYENVLRMPNDNYLAVGEKYSILDSKFSSLIQKSFEYSSPYAGGGALVKDTGYTFIVNSNGIRYIYFDNELEESSGIGEGKIACKINGKYSYYDLEGQKLYGEYDFAGRFSNGVAAVRIGDIWKLIREDGSELTNTEFNDIKLTSSCACAEANVIVAKTNDKYSYYSTEGNRIGNFEFDDGDVFLDNDSWAAFCVDGKWGFADSTGKVMIEPEYDSAKSFLNGLAGVKTGEKWSFIDTSNREIITGEFEDTDYFTSTGRCFIKQNGLWTSIVRYYY